MNRNSLITGVGQIVMNSKLKQLCICSRYVCMLIPILLAEKVNSLTIADAVEIAIEKNSRALQIREKVKEKEYDKWVAIGSFLPMITLQGSYNFLDEPLTMDLDVIRDAIIQLETNNQVQLTSLKSRLGGGSGITEGSPQYVTAYSYAKNTLEERIPHFTDTLKKQQYPATSIIAVQPIFTGLRLLSAVKAANQLKASVSGELKKIENDIAKETIQGCLNVLLVQKVMQIRSDVLDGMKKHLQKAQLLSEQGMIAKYHLLRAKVAVAEAERNFFEENNRYDLTRLYVSRLCMLNDTSDININDTLKYAIFTDAIPCLLKQAQENQPVFEILKRNSGIADAKLLAQKGVLYPQLSAFGKYELFPDYLSALEPKWAVGIQFSLILFNGGKNISAIQSTIHQIKQLNQIDSIAHRDIDLLINKTYRDMKNAEERYKHLGADLSLAEENLHQCQSRFESGFGTSLEVIDAQLVVERNKIDRLTALCDYYKAISEIYAATGKPFETLKYFKKGV
jgi:outer membrane protein TolC